MTAAFSPSLRAPSPSTPSSIKVSSAPVMVVDDDPEIREILKEILVGAGYAVVTVANGVEALESLKSVTLSLILLDLNMPVMDGFEFRRAQRRDPAVARVPTVVMSALHRMAERIADLAVDDALEKPVSLDRLLEVVAHYCG